MKRYIAFLRGVNISGKNRVSMPDLKQAMLEAGFSDVSTYLNSGNIVFKSEEGDAGGKIRQVIRDRFDLDIPVYVIAADVLQDVLAHAPAWWNTGDKGRYDNLVFILSEDTPEEICSMIGEPSEGLEQVQIYRQFIFWTFDRKQYGKCSWWKKTAVNGIAERLTIRTAGTVIKVCEKGR
ncbi:MAG: DUF1697 domain-containing protein [Solobacterium sp.]|nr:DUF1697 domain-containing protein [Solobacterium sp.]